MGNADLFYWFQALSKENTFDIELKLKDKQTIKEYKKSSFYKKTKMPIKKAYRLYLLTPLKNIIHLFNTEAMIQVCNGNFGFLAYILEDIVDGFDVSKIDNVLDYITAKISDIDFESLQNKLGKAVKEYKEKIAGTLK